MNYKLQDLSNGTKNAQIKVWMTKLWPYKVGVKTGDYCMTLRRSGLVLGGFLAHFEPIMEGFKTQTRGIENGEDL